MKGAALSKTNPRRGEVWEINLDITTGSLPQKSQLAVVISSDAFECLTTRLVVPIVSWEDRFSGVIWIVPIKPNDNNSLTLPSAADATLTWSVAVKHFSGRRGKLNAILMEEIAAAIAAVIEL